MCAAPGACRDRYPLSGRRERGTTRGDSAGPERTAALRSEQLLFYYHSYLKKRLSTTACALQEKSCPDKSPGCPCPARRSEWETPVELPRPCREQLLGQRPAGGRRRQRDSGTHGASATQAPEERCPLSQSCSSPARPCCSSREGEVPASSPLPAATERQPDFGCHLCSSTFHSTQIYNWPSTAGTSPAPTSSSVAGSLGPPNLIP
ncbi:uncharacterized protein LOC110397598 [Numida meleagris]|uniref:uncharacterized protein LOC110397598 n=1 Tax=Numida meleagris TaxID=8996 RepID=UPI000B3DDCBA|nr:uncharacterized protein LOC110397598 [Numida meleagris]